MRSREPKSPRHAIGEELFRSTLSRERKRSDRSDQPLLLLLVDVSTDRNAESAAIRESVVEALTAAKREMDILGWFEWRTVIGLIVPEILASDLVGTRKRLDARVRRELATRLGAEMVAGISMRFHV